LTILARLVRPDPFAGIDLIHQDRATSQVDAQADLAEREHREGGGQRQQDQPDTGRIIRHFEHPRDRPSQQEGHDQDRRKNGHRQVLPGRDAIAHGGSVWGGLGEQRNHRGNKEVQTIHGLDRTCLNEDFGAGDGAGREHPCLFQRD